MSWRCVDAFAVGRSHQRTDAPCQDRCTAAVVTSSDGTDVLVEIVSDGAGSAAFGERGAQLVCDTLVELARASVGGSSDLDALEDELLRSWFLTARERLRTLARAADTDVRDGALGARQRPSNGVRADR